MLKKIKDDYFSKNVQFILTDYDGVILESDQTLLQIKVGSLIEDVHPFFTSVLAIRESSGKSTIFNCVQFGLKAMEQIVDIEMHKKKGVILVRIHDLTEHYTSYQEIAQARNESIINSELVVIKNLELQEREKFKNQFIRNFSHELRNPLTSITSITSIIKNTSLTDAQDKMVDFLVASNTNLKLMLEDILSIGMISSGKLALVTKVFSLNELLELLKFTYNAKAKEQGLEFKLELDDKLPQILEGDRLRLYQVLTNLLDNAFKNTNEGEVALKVHFNQKWANKVSMRFEVVDTGIGIPEESIAHIFKSFFQIDVQQKVGAGLGLPIVEGLLSLMNSKIKVKSTLAQGSVFYFDVTFKYPLHPPKEVISKAVSRKKNSKVHQKSTNNYRILLVEDDEQVQMMLFKILLSQKCFKVDFESDGAKVMELVASNTYDLILMDVNLPNIRGDQVAKLIRTFPFKNIKKIPIIGITANAYPDDLKSYKSSGMNAVLTKPFEESDLLGQIFKFLK